MWLLQMFLPVYLTQLVDEREQRIRLMMKLQGLQDRAYWIITYVWFLTLYVAFAVMLMIFGGPILTAAQAELPFFTMNDSGIIFLFFFLYGNIQIALVFVLCACFKTKKSANVTAYIWVFASSLLCGILFNDLIEQDRWFLPLLELIPGFGLYRGLFDLGNYSFLAAYQNKAGRTFATLSDKQNGMLEVWIIFIAEWPLLMLLAHYLDQVLDLGTGIKRDPLFFLESFGFRRKMRTYAGKDTEGLVGAASLTVTSPDVVQETKRVQAMATVADMDTVTVRNLRKVRVFVCVCARARVPHTKRCCCCCTPLTGPAPGCAELRPDEQRPRRCSGGRTGCRTRWRASRCRWGSRRASASGCWGRTARARRRRST